MGNIARGFALLGIGLLFFACKNIPGNQSEHITESRRLLLVINYPYQIWSEDPTKIHVTLLKPDFSPAAGARVWVNDKEVGQADGNGICIFDYLPSSNQTHLLKARLVEGATEYTVGKRFACNARTVSFKAERLYVYTDRGVYNPGQDILVRLLAWQLKREYSPLPAAKVQLLFQDTRGKVFSGRYVVTDEYGVGGASISLPEHMPEGDYDLVVLFEQSRESARIRVKRFRPPVINITHSLPRYITPSSESLGTKVSLEYFSGGKPEAAALTLSIATAQGRELFSKRFSTDIAELSIGLDKKELEGVKSKLTPDTEIKLKLAVTDGYGRSDEVVWDMFYTTTPYYAVLETDKDAYQQDEQVQLLVKVTDIDGQPAKGIPLTMSVDILRLEKTGKTDEQGVADFSFPMPDSAVTAVIKSPLMSSPLGTRAISPQRQKPMNSKVAGPPGSMGMKSKIIVMFDPEYIPVEKVVHIDLTDISGSLVWSGVIPVSTQEDRYLARGEITAPTWGTMLVNLYCCAVKKEQSSAPYSTKSVGFITEGQHITFYPERELQIEVQNLKPLYAPGEKAAFTITVKGGEGEKCLGVSVTDAAVLSLLNPFIKPPFSHFYNPQAKVIATGGAGVLTWPVVDRNWGYPWRDIAYTNWGWKDPGDPVESREYDKLAESANEAESTSGMAGDLPAEPHAKKAKPSGAPKDQETLDGDGRRKPETLQASPPKTIIIRTRFPETAFWEPDLITSHGRSRIELELPHEITTQKLTIMASDKHGYLGFVQKDIKVSQPLFIRSLLPASFIQGDTLMVRGMVRNLAGSPLSCRARLESDELLVEDPAFVDLTLKPDETRLVEWRISAARCGRGHYRVSVQTSGFRDVEEKEFTVLPSTRPAVQNFKADIGGGSGFEKKFTIDSGADYYTAAVNVALPNVFPAFEAYYAFNAASWYTPWALSATVIMNAALLDAGNSLGLPAGFRGELLNKLGRAALLLASSQRADGSWGFYAAQAANQSGNLYYTVSCLRALCELTRVGISVNPESVVRAVRYILDKRNQAGLWSSKGAYFWEVYNQDTDYALSAEAFEVLCYALTLVPELSSMEPEVRPLKEIMLDLLSARPTEPMTVAAALQGLMYMRDYYKDRSLSPVLADGINFLITLKRHAYWEPHWYHAYGGMVELNARILTLLAASDPQGYGAYLREGVTWLLSTREAWGAWHNELGTAEAVRALLKCGVFAQEKRSVISVRVNNQEVARVDIDPRDPFLSAASLAYLEITSWLTKGENTVTVSYNGALSTSVILEVKTWSPAALHAADKLVVTRTSSGTASPGQPVPVKLTLSSAERIPFLTIVETVPANCEADTKSLENLVISGQVTGYTLTHNTLSLSVADFSGKRELTYSIIPIQAGTCAGGGTVMIDASSGKTLASLEASILSVK